MTDNSRKDNSHPDNQEASFVDNEKAEPPATFAIIENTDERRRKPLPEQSANDIDLYFSHLNCLTYVLIANSKDFPADTVSTALPTPVAAAAMIDAALAGDDFDRPYDVAKESSTGTKYTRAEVVHQIEQRVQELKRRNVEFVFVWHIAGDKTVHWDSSDGADDFAYSDRVIDFLAEEVEDHLAFFDPRNVCGDIVESSEVDDDPSTSNMR